MIDPAHAKTFVLDTNVLLHNPLSLFAFADNHVVIPMVVLEELDKFKGANNELGQNSREVARSLDRLRAQGSLREGVATPQGGLIQVVIAFDEVAGMLPGVNDNRIIGCAHMLMREGRHVLFISKDINARVKADALGIPSQDFENQKVNIDELYTGWAAVKVPAAKLKALCGRDTARPTELAVELDGALNANQFVLVQDEQDEDHSALFAFDADKGVLRHLDDEPPMLFGVGPRSPEQRMAFELLLDDRIKLVTLMGKAGTGKTLIAMAAGLKRVVSDREFRRLVVARPTISMGKELGFLPGSLEEKLAPWMQPIHDALEMLSDLNMGHEHRRAADLMRSGSIVVEALSYIRGRSIANQFMIIDESQNLTPLEAKTIVTRVGSGTKLIFTGDPYQIDNPYVDSSSNGFNYVVSRFRDQAIAAHIELQKGERSELAELAANIL